MSDIESDLDLPKGDIVNEASDLARDVSQSLSENETRPPRRLDRRFIAAYFLPTLLILIAVCLPLISGERSLFLRDVFGTHLEMKWFQAEAMRDGSLPLIDPYRGGGQPHLGNPNTVALYPTNLLYLVADTYWAFNAHFWLHLLVAPFAMFWLARRWRLPPQAAWMAGVVYAANGYFLSNLNLYNLVAPVALAPALIAACIALVEDEKRARPFIAVGLLWALMVLGGDPMTAALAAVMALSAAAFRVVGRWRRGIPLGAAFGLGTLVALPQIVEFLRVLPHSYRGFFGYSEAGATVASWTPRAAVEWFLPLFFGWPDLGFWGREYSGGDMPLFFSVAPGVLALALVMSSGRLRRHVSWWSWGAVGLGLLLALGSHNPILGWILRTTGVSFLRLPTKFWLLVAIGGSLLAALGFERLTVGKPRAFKRALGTLLVLYGAFWAFLSFGGGFEWGRRRIPTNFADGFVDHERLRWAGIALVSLLTLGAALGLVKLLERHRGLLALLPVLHLATQIFFLKPLLPTEEVDLYRAAPELLAEIPKSATVVHGDYGSLFGSARMPLESYPDQQLIWFQRQTHGQLYPHSGVLFGRHYELDHSPEGLDAFLTRAAAQAMKILPDPARVKLLEASGVDRLIVSRRLEALEAAGSLERIASEAVSGLETEVYSIPNHVDRARVVGSIERSPHLNATLERLTSADFDARTGTILPGPGDDQSGRPGTVRWIEDRPESMVLEVDAPDGGALVVQRTPLAILSAEVDGEPAAIVPADLHRIGVELAPGSHTVRIWADRTALRLSFGLALVGLLAIFLVGSRLRSPSETS